MSVMVYQRFGLPSGMTDPTGGEIGYFDDAFVIGLCLSMVRNDIERYREWRKVHCSANKTVREKRF